MISNEDIINKPQRVIWLADFHYDEVIRTKGRGVVTIERSGVAEDVLAVGSDRIKILRNPMFMKRVYQSVYGKEKWLKRYDEKTLTITKIELKKPISLSFAPEYR